MPLESNIFDQAPAQTPTAYRVPQANAAAKLAPGWLPVMVGTDGAVSGAPGAVPAPDSTATVKFLRGDGVWAIPAGDGTGATVHSDLTGLDADGHPQYALTNGTRGNFEPTGTAAAAITTHNAATDPHGDRAYTNTSSAAAQAAAETTAATALTAHHAPSSSDHDDRYYTEAEVDTRIAAAIATYVHDQATPSTIWTVTHNLSRYPSVTTIDSAGTQVFGGLAYVSVNELVISFSSAFGGKAFLN